MWIQQNFLFTSHATAPAPLGPASPQHGDRPGDHLAQPKRQALPQKAESQVALQQQTLQLPEGSSADGLTPVVSTTEGSTSSLGSTAADVTAAGFISAGSTIIQHLIPSRPMQCCIAIGHQTNVSLSCQYPYLIHNSLDSKLILLLMLGYPGPWQLKQPEVPLEAGQR